MDRTVVRSRPDDAGLKPRCADRVQRRIYFLAGHVAGNRLAGGHLTLRPIRRHVRADPRPVDAAVDGFMQVLRPVIHDLWVVRIDLNRRLTYEPEVHVLGVLAVALLWVHPIVLFLPGLNVVPAELALAVAVDDLAVRRGAALPALTA